MENNHSTNKNNEEKDIRLDLITTYKMDEFEAKAHKLSLIWIDKSKKIFPNYNHTGLKKGDPRKSSIFKYCYKFLRETSGIISEDDYPLYIRAQLDVLKHIYSHSKTPILIDPACLVGDKAWVRWKLWKKKYDSVSQKPTEISQITHPGIAKALSGFEKTKEFLTKTIGASPDIERYREAKMNKNFFRWVNLGKISPYYLAASPFIKEVFNDEDFKKMNFDLEVYKPCLTDFVMQTFNEMFQNEKIN